MGCQGKVTGPFATLIQETLHHLGSINPVNNGINYQPQLVQNQKKRCFHSLVRWRRWGLSKSVMEWILERRWETKNKPLSHLIITSWFIKDSHNKKYMFHPTFTCWKTKPPQKPAKNLPLFFPQVWFPPSIQAALLQGVFLLVGSFGSRRRFNHRRIAAALEIEAVLSEAVLFGKRSRNLQGNTIPKSNKPPPENRPLVLGSVHQGLFWSICCWAHHFLKSISSILGLYTPEV